MKVVDGPLSCTAERPCLQGKSKSAAEGFYHVVQVVSGFATTQPAGKLRRRCGERFAGISTTTPGLSNLSYAELKATMMGVKGWSTNRPWLVALLLGMACPGFGGPGLAEENREVLTRIAFGSCANQQNPCPIWQTIADANPDLLLLLGDNIYADIVDGRLRPATPERIAEAYQQLAALPEFDKLRRRVPILATWDDHDYGDNDAGAEWEHKDIAAEMFHDFFGTPRDSPRRRQAGVYNATTFGPPGKRVQVIMLDTRYFRSELQQAEERMPGWRSRPYQPATGPDVTMLGEMQWQWLEEQLREPAEVRIIGSSIQVISDEHPFEKWDNFPNERERLYRLIRQTGAGGVVIISGDRHLADLSLDTDAVGYPLYDITASGLNQATEGWRAMEPNRKRVAGLPFGHHFGMIEIDWDRPVPQLSLQIRHEDGEIALQARVPLDVLDGGPIPLPLPEGVIDATAASRLEPGTEVTVQMVVRGGRVIGDRTRILLNSEKDYQSDRNFTVVVNRSALAESLADADLELFLNRAIRVSGVISLYNGSSQMVVDASGQLQLVP